LRCRAAEPEASHPPGTGVCQGISSSTGRTAASARMRSTAPGELSVVPDDTVLYPGHMYSAEPNAPMGDVRRTNVVFRPRTRDQWMMMFGNAG
jgi:hypothetical protein